MSMKIYKLYNRYLIVAVSLLSLVLLAACSTPTKNAALDSANASYTTAKADPNISGNAEASTTLEMAAETLDKAAHQFDLMRYFENDDGAPQSSPQEVDQLAYIAQQQVALATAIGAKDAADQQIASLEQEREAAHLAKQDIIEQELSIALAQAKRDGAVIERDGDQIKVTFRDVTFELNKADIRQEFKNNLDQIAEALEHRYPTASLTVEGYTDITGSEKFNEQLSEDRAISVQTYFIDQGLDPERVKSRGMGVSNPIASNDTPEGRAKNRRVELIIDGEPQM